MCKRVLIPTDFSGHSLMLIQTAIDEHPNESLDIILAFGFKLALSTSDLLFYSRSKMMKSLIPAAFQEAVQATRKESKTRINSIQIEPFYGTTDRAIGSFLEGNRIDEIYIYKNYQSHYGHTGGFDITPLIAKMDKVHKIPFFGYISEGEYKGSFAESCLSKVFG